MTMPLLAAIDRLSSRQRFSWVAAGAFGLLGAGLVIGVIEKLNPCPLCIFQRVLYIVVGFAALAAALAGNNFQKTRLIAAWAGIAACAGGLATAIYQTYMQAFPGAIAECSFTEPNLIERLVFWLGEYWEFMFLATGLCGARDWTFLGLSMANWSIPCFAAFGLALIWALRGKGD